MIQGVCNAMEVRTGLYTARAVVTNAIKVECSIWDSWVRMARARLYKYATATDYFIMNDLFSLIKFNSFVPSLPPMYNAASCIHGSSYYVCHIKDGCDA